MRSGSILRTMVGFALWLGMTAAAVPSAASTLTVEVDNVRNGKGKVHVGLWMDPDGFTDGDRLLVGEAAPAEEGKKVIEFKDLPPGRYALAVFHDENDNGEFDTSWIGLPAEGLGFSNGAWIGFGPPSFEDAAVELKGAQKQIVIALRY